jgi:hypothetical protein
LDPTIQLEEAGEEGGSFIATFPGTATFTATATGNVIGMLQMNNWQRQLGLLSAKKNASTVANRGLWARAESSPRASQGEGGI